MPIEDLELTHVSLKMKALRRFWSGYTGIYVFVSVQRGSIDDTTLSNVADAASGATPDAERVWINGWIPVPGGWHGQQTSRGGHGWAMRQRWFEAFAAELDQVLGDDDHVTVTSGPLKHPRLDASGEWELTANVAYTPVDPHRRDAHMHWLPSPEATVELFGAVERWVAMPAEWDTTTYLRRLGGTVPVEVDPVAPLLIKAQENGENTTLSVERSRPPSERKLHDVKLIAMNSGVYRVLSNRHSTDSWPLVRDKLIEALTLAPAHTDYGYVRYANAGAAQPWQHATRDMYWLSQDLRGRRLAPAQWMDVNQNDFTSHPVLFGEYVPDVNGIQLVNESHLAKARDLSGWDLEPLAGGRYLLSARDLEPWYGQLETDPDVVARAQHDFGDMILTLEALAAADIGPIEQANVERRIHLQTHPEDATEYEQRIYFIGFYAQR